MTMSASPPARSCITFSDGPPWRKFDVETGLVIETGGDGVIKPAVLRLGEPVGQHPDLGVRPGPARTPQGGACGNAAGAAHVFWKSVSSILRSPGVCRGQAKSEPCRRVQTGLASKSGSGRAIARP